MLNALSNTASKSDSEIDLSPFILEWKKFARNSVGLFRFDVSSAFMNTSNDDFIVSLKDSCETNHKPTVKGGFENSILKYR